MYLQEGRDLSAERRHVFVRVRFLEHQIAGRPTGAGRDGVVKRRREPLRGAERESRWAMSAVMPVHKEAGVFYLTGFYAADM